MLLEEFPLRFPKNYLKKKVEEEDEEENEDEDEDEDSDYELDEETYQILSTGEGSHWDRVPFATASRAVNH
jgi:hypothetical protein